MTLFQKLLFSFSSLLLVFLPVVPSAFAADIRGEDSIVITDENQRLNNPYLFGERVEVSSPVDNDLVTGGSNLDLESSVSGSVWAAGGDINIDSAVGNSIRVAGGNIVINGPIRQDVIAIGGNIHITDNAIISGDLIFLGGQLKVDGTINGNVIANGGQVRLNNTVGGNVSGEMGELILGQNAQIAGNLSYKAQERGSLNENQVGGEITFEETNKAEEGGAAVAGAVSAGLFYKLIADVIFTLILVWLLRPFINRVFTRMQSSYLQSGGLGFAVLLLMPIASLFLLLIVWLGFFSFLLYLLMLILALGITKVFLGFKVIQWWGNRNNKKYILDWKAAVVGVILMFILGLVPFFGWFVGFILFLISLGGLTREIYSYLSPNNQKSPTATRKNK